jgi:L-alanine-DL-glutamate epimerase-like enolase superfamily enzyme
VSRPTDVRVVDAALYFIPVRTRVPLKFGPEVMTSVTCARVELTVEDRSGGRATGWAETPLSVQWVWPSDLPYEVRNERLKEFCRLLAAEWPGFPVQGHPLEVGHTFLAGPLPDLLRRTNGADPEAAMPWLAALVCCSPFDLALYDAYGKLHNREVYQTYGSEFISRDLGDFLVPAHTSIRFTGQFPDEYLVKNAPSTLRAWHLVGGVDPLDESELTGSEPDDGYPVVLRDWIERDGLKCLKIKLRGTDAAWDYARIVSVGQIAIERDIEWLSVDFNCTVTDPAYVNAILDRLVLEQPRIYGMVLYVEQPFPYDLETYPIDVRSTAARKPLFMDESAHDWQHVRLGRERGWTGVALKTCKTQTGAILGLCWARAHGMTLMVQDLSNPMLAQIPHLLLAAHAGTIMGVETNSMQFYPEASAPEAAIHPGIYRRRNGLVDLSTLRGPGFGYRLDEIHRELPAPETALVQTMQPPGR